MMLGEEQKQISNKNSKPLFRSFFIYASTIMNNCSEFGKIFVCPLRRVCLVSILFTIFYLVIFRSVLNSV